MIQLLLRTSTRGRGPVYCCAFVSVISAIILRKHVGVHVDLHVGFYAYVIRMGHAILVVNVAIGDNVLTVVGVHGRPR